MNDRNRRVLIAVVVGLLPALWTWGFVNGIVDVTAGRNLATLLLRVADQNIVSSDGYGAALHLFTEYQGYWLNGSVDPFAFDSLLLIGSTMLFIVPANMIYLAERGFGGWSRHLAVSLSMSATMFVLMIAMVDPSFDCVRDYLNG